MFTGLVERTGQVTSIIEAASPLQVWTLIVDPGADYPREFGASVAVNGVCLTEVGAKTDGPLTFHVSPETLAKTSLSGVKPGQLVNLERAMRPNDRLGGHIMLGHVDGTGEVTEIYPDQGFWRLGISIASDLGRYVVRKGSIAIDGVSLTVNDLRDTHDATHLSFMLIPVTWQSTRFHTTAVGSSVNIEVDMIAKHLERLVEPWKVSRD